MTTVFLKYGNYTGTTLTYSTASTFSVLSCIERHTRNVIVSDTMRKNKSLNKLFTRIYYDLRVGADVLSNATNMTFFKNFFKADAWQLSFDNINFIDVIFEDDEFNLEYLNDSIYLPNWSVKLWEKEAE